MSNNNNNTKTLLKYIVENDNDKAGKLLNTIMRDKMLQCKKMEKIRVNSELLNDEK